MNWINTFELICYVLTVILVCDIVRKRHWHELELLLSGALAGFTLELAAVRFTDIYHYSDAYWITIGIPPYQFPFFGGLMWGGVAVCALRIAQKLPWNRLLTALFSGWLVVSMDLLLDVAAIRLDGGFWVWEGRPLTLDINHHMWMSVIWVNFLGYLMETPALIYFTLKLRERSHQQPSTTSMPEEKKDGERSGDDQSLRQSRGIGTDSLKIIIRSCLRVIVVGLGAVLFVAVGSGIALYLDRITDEWASFLIFAALWLLILGKLFVTLKHHGKNLTWRGEKDRVLILFWTALYGYCLVALASLGIFTVRPLYAVLGIFLMTLTLALSLVQIQTDTIR